MDFLKKIIGFILRLFGITPEKEKLIRLNANAELNFDADANKTISDVCAVFSSYERDTVRAVNAHPHLGSGVLTPSSGPLFLRNIVR